MTKSQKKVTTLIGKKKTQKKKYQHIKTSQFQSMVGNRSGAYRNEGTNDKRVSNHRKQEDPKHRNQNSKKKQ